MIAPADAIEISPKLSFSDDLLSFFIFVSPSDNDNKNGTANIPVVTPEESKAIANISNDVFRDSRKMIP